MISEQKREVKRGAVHITGHPQGGVYYVNELGELLVRLEQVDVWGENGRMKKLVRQSMIAGDPIAMIQREYWKNQQLPGNIRIIEQLEPPIPDEPEECLYWNEDHSEIQRDKDGYAIYRYQTYCPTEKWEANGEIDQIISEY